MVYYINLSLLDKIIFGSTIYVFSIIISARPRKPELIIHENEPVELPPDVVRGTKHVCCGNFCIIHYTTTTVLKTFLNLTT